MKIIASFSLILLTSGAAWSQTRFSGALSAGTDVEVVLDSKLEPPEPQVALSGVTMGIRVLPGMTRGMRRYSANANAHEYFGYDLHVHPVDLHAGVYRVTFSALTLTPLEMNLSDSTTWRGLPPPAFPEPQLVKVGDTILLTLLENPVTGQKVVDYISLKRHNCDTDSGSNQIACLNSLIEDEQKSQSGKMAYALSKRGLEAAAPLQESQPLWERYRDAACANSNEAKRLQCKLELTRERTHDIGNVY